MAACTKLYLEGDRGRKYVYAVIPVCRGYKRQSSSQSVPSDKTANLCPQHGIRLL